MAMSLDEAFPRYDQQNPAAPIWCITTAMPGCWHRFFDTSHFSPSGRYVALT